MNNAVVHLMGIKNMKNRSSIAATLGAMAILTSCVARKPYERPDNIIPQETLFRSDQLPQDSTSLGAVSWKEIFTDQVLQNHISKALDHNLDIRMALQNIVSAEAFLKQSKAAYLP